MPVGAFLRSFRRDRRGVSAVEFAFIAPVMLTFYFGMAEYCQAMMCERKAIRVASSVGDLVAQKRATTPAEVADILAISSTIMTPFPTTGAIKMCVASMSANSSGAVTIDWSEQSGDTTCPNAGAGWTPPANLVAANESLVMARVIYTYSSPVKYLLTRDPVFNKSYYLRPRATTKVSCTAC